jgi:hypothetical protein
MLPRSQSASVTSIESYGLAQAKDAKERGAPRYTVLSAVTVFLLFLCLGLFADFAADRVWDDGYMFVRYAHNLLSQGQIAWNPDGPPTYGLTSLAFLLVTTPLHMLFPNNATLVATLSSIISGVAFVSALLLLLSRGIESSLPFSKPLMIATVFIVMAGAIEHISAHFLSGMDTMFALTYLSLLILSFKWFEKKATWHRAIIVSIVAAVAFTVRPDLLLFSLIVPLALAKLSDSTVAGKSLSIAGITSALVALQMAAAYLYFGSPVPLPFFAKAMRIYGDGFEAHYHLISIRELFFFLVYYWTMFVFVGVDIITNRRRWLRIASPVDVGLLAATILFIFYYLFAVLQIMFFHQRFFYPILPAILFLAAQSGVRLIERNHKILAQQWAQSSKALSILTALLVLTLISPSIAFFVRCHHLGTFLRSDMSRFTTEDAYYPNGGLSWCCLPEIAQCISAGMTIATTEVGLPSVMNYDYTIVDMAGLNNRRLMLGGFSADVLLTDIRPDILYMPHPHYEEMTAQLLENLASSSQYEFIPGEELPSDVGIALNRDGAYFDELSTRIRNAQALSAEVRHRD